MSTRWRILVLVGLCLLAPNFESPRADAQELPSSTQPWARGKNRQAARAEYEQNLARYKDQADVLVLPGLLANRKQKWVRVQAEATGIGPEAAMEFFLIGEGGNDYEALAVSMAQPSDVHKALECVGLPLGRPVDYGKLQLWPKGERVFMTFKWTEAPAAGAALPTPREVPAEELFVDTRSGKPLPRTGMVFVGRWAQSPQEPGKQVYAPDLSGARSIASNYNEPATVLDLPRRAEQHAVYSTQKANPAYHLQRGQMIEVVLEPEHKDGKRRVMDLSLRITVKAGSDGGSIRDLAFALSDDTGAKLNKADDLPTVLASVERIPQVAHDRFISLNIGSSIRLSALRQFCAVLATVISSGQIYLEPPPQGELWYEAMLPNETLRDRRQRPVQPWELRLDKQSGAISGVFTQLDDTPNRAEGEPPLVIKDVPAASADALRKILEDQKDQRRELYVFAPGELSYGELLQFIRPAIDARVTFYVFLEGAKPATSRRSFAPASAAAAPVCHGSVKSIAAATSGRMTHP